MLSKLFAPPPATPTPPEPSRQIVIPIEEYDREAFVRGAERLATLFLERARVSRAIGAEREMLDFASGRVREGATSALDGVNHVESHYAWLQGQSLDRLHSLWTTFRAIDKEMRNLSSSLDPDARGE